MPSDDQIRLRYRLDDVLEASAFAWTKQGTDLDGDRMLELALVKVIEIIGEAAAGVSRGTQSKTTDILWSDIIGMRHRLIHAYFDVDLDVVWQTIEGDLPPRITKLSKNLGIDDHHTRPN